MPSTGSEYRKLEPIHTGGSSAPPWRPNLRWPLEQVEFMPVSGCHDLAIFRKKGNKRPILFTAGGTWSGARWGSFFTYLSWRYPELTDHEWVTWDLPGRGWSSRPARTETSWLTAQDLAAMSHEMMLKLHGNQPYVRVGHSNGCVSDLAALAQGWGEAFVMIDPAPIDMTLEDAPDATNGGLRQRDYGGMGDVAVESDAMRIDAFTSGQQIREAEYPHAPGVVIRADFTHPDLRQHRDFLRRQKTDIANALLMNLVTTPSSHWIQFSAGGEPGTFFGKPDVVGYSLATIMRHVESADKAAEPKPCVLDPMELRIRHAELTNFDTLQSRLETPDGELAFPAEKVRLEHLERSASVEREWRLLFAADSRSPAVETSQPERFATIVANDPAGGAQLIADWLDQGRTDMPGTPGVVAGLRLLAQELAAMRNDPRPSPQMSDPRVTDELSEESSATRFIRHAPFEYLTILGKELEKRKTYRTPNDDTFHRQLHSALQRHHEAVTALTTTAAELLLAEETDPFDHPAIAELRSRYRDTDYEWTTFDRVFDILNKTEELSTHKQWRDPSLVPRTVTRTAPYLPPPSRPTKGTGTCPHGHEPATRRRRVLR